MTVEKQGKPQPEYQTLEERNRRAVQMHLQFFLGDEPLNGVQIEPISLNKHTRRYSVALPGRAIVVEGEINDKGTLLRTRVVMDFALTEETISRVLSTASLYLQEKEFPPDCKPEGLPKVTPKTTDMEKIKKGDGLIITLQISGSEGKVGAVVGPLKLDGGWKFVPESFLPKQTIIQV